MLNARFGHDWVKRHGFDNKGKLPAHAPPRKGKGKSRAQITARDKLIAGFMAKHAGGARGRTVR
jgi:hypothetical protein